VQRFLSDVGGPQEAFQLSSLAFRKGHAQLSRAGRAELRALAAALSSFPEARVRFIGHTDSSGPRAINLEVSKARAQAAVAALIDAGFPAERATAEGMGEAQPIASNRTAAGRWRNRRVEIVVSRS
jgi:outer membrane protein OmpA-like peptidoglycan-associated protein